jgi:hypothetical protein
MGVVLRSEATMSNHDAPNLPWTQLDRIITDNNIELVRVPDVWQQGFAIVGKRPPISEQVATDKVKEWWLQQYVKQYPQQFGLTSIDGPNEVGPDFQATMDGQLVDVEVEVQCQNYTKHDHHKNKAFANVRIMIVLEGKEPSPKTRAKYPEKIVHIDKAHFERWYEEAARQYALRKEKEQPHVKNRVRLEVVAGAFHRRWVEECPDKAREMAVCPDCDCCPYFQQRPEIFEDMALQFLQKRNTPDQIDLGNISDEELDDFYFAYPII